MKFDQTLLADLDLDARSGKLLPTAQLVQAFEAVRPLDNEKLAALARCLTECSEQIYEYYRPMINMFREEIAHADPDEKIIRTGIELGILDDEEWGE